MDRQLISGQSEVTATRAAPTIPGNPAAPHALRYCRYVPLTHAPDGEPLTFTVTGPTGPIRDLDAEAEPGDDRRRCAGGRPHGVGVLGELRDRGGAAIPWRRLAAMAAELPRDHRAPARVVLVEEAPVLTR